MMMNLKYRGLLVVLGAAVVLSAAGCGGKRKPVRVTGTVTLDGKPLSGATVTFIPVEGHGRNAGGLTDDEGEFELTTFNSGDGALPGEYQVTVTLTDSKAAQEFFEQSRAGDPEEKWKTKMMRHSPDEKAKLKAAFKKAPSLVPDIYGKVDTTPFKQHVPPGGTVRLDVKSNRKGP